MWIIPKTGIAVHQSIPIKIGREHTNAAFPSNIDVHGHGGDVPIVISRSLYRTAMTRTGNKAPWFIAKRVVGSVGKRSQRGIAHIGAVAVHIEFGSRGRILQVVSVIAFCHPWALYIAS